MGHDRLPDEPSHCRGQPGPGERPSRRQQSWFCNEHMAQTRRRNTCAASHPSPAASTDSNHGRITLGSTARPDSALLMPHPDPRCRLLHCIMPVHMLAPAAAVAPSIQRPLERVDSNAFVLIAAMNPYPCGYFEDPVAPAPRSLGRLSLPEAVVNSGPNKETDRPTTPRLCSPRSCES